MKNTSKPTMSLRERNKRRTREEILIAALATFNEVGFTKCSAEKVLQHAGISRGTLYGYFPGGVEEIFREIYVELSEEVIAIGSDLRERESDPQKRILGLATALFDLCSSPEKGRFYSHIRPSLTVILEPVLGGASETFGRFIAEDLSNCLAGKNKQGTASIQALTVLITGAMREASIKVSENPSTKQRYLKAIKNLTAALLANPGPLSGED